jgi:hypothetical protein
MSAAELSDEEDPVVCAWCECSYIEGEGFWYEPFDDAPAPNIPAGWFCGSGCWLASM